MGNTVYSSSLIGMTIPEAEKFIRQNIVYYDPDHKNYRITMIRNVDDAKALNHHNNRLNVYVLDNVIDKILTMG
jgi:hypothetical protein